jgi:hypothetical protein
MEKSDITIHAYIDQQSNQDSPQLQLTTKKRE